MSDPIERAFPRENAQHGMTLRDYFAAQALIGVGSWCPSVNLSEQWPPDGEVQRRRAIWAYGQADAMLEARKQ